MPPRRTHPFGEHAESSITFHTNFMKKSIKKALTLAALTLAALVGMPEAQAAYNPDATSRGFVSPAPPRRSAMPDRRLPNLGRDK